MLVLSVLHHRPALRVGATRPSQKFLSKLLHLSANLRFVHKERLVSFHHNFAVDQYRMNAPTINAVHQIIHQVVGVASLEAMRDVENRRELGMEVIRLVKAAKVDGSCDGHQIAAEEGFFNVLSCGCNLGLSGQNP